MGVGSLDVSGMQASWAEGEGGARRGFSSGLGFLPPELALLPRAGCGVGVGVRDSEGGLGRARGKQALFPRLLRPRRRRPPPSASRLQKRRRLSL